MTNVFVVVRYSVDQRVSLHPNEEVSVTQPLDSLLHVSDRAQGYLSVSVSLT